MKKKLILFNILIFKVIYYYIINYTIQYIIYQLYIIL